MSCPITEWRKKHGITRIDAALVAGVSYAHWSSIELGNRSLAPAIVAAIREIGGDTEAKAVTAAHANWLVDRRKEARSRILAAR